MSSTRTETKDVCGACGNSAGCVSWLACEICEGWFHSSCVKINDEQYKVMQELATCHWFCQLCDTKLGKIIPTIVRLSDRVTEVDKRVISVEKEISVRCDKVEKVTEDVNKSQ